MSDRKADLLTRLAIASGHAPPCPDRIVDAVDPAVTLRDSTPDDWAAHLMAHAEALGRAVDAKLTEAPGPHPRHAPGCIVTPAYIACEFDCPARKRRLADPTDSGHDPECAVDSCAAGCPDAVRAREDGERRATARIVVALRQLAGRAYGDSAMAISEAADAIEAGRL